MTNANSTAWTTFANLLSPLPNPYVNDPVGWIRDVLGEDLWSGQEWMARAVVDHDRIVVKAGQSVGKTRIISRLIAWFVCVHPVEHVRVVVTADNFDQITGTIWRELLALKVERDALARTDPTAFTLPGNITLDAKWHAGPGNKIEVAVGTKPGDKNPTGIQGRHARHLLCFIEEACGVPKEIWEAVDGLASNEGSTVFAVGNPTDPSAYMAEVCKPGSGWVTKKIASTDTPEFTGEQVSSDLLGVLASRTWVEAKRQLWGESSPQYISRVLGEFPEVANDTLFQPKHIEAAQKRSIERTWKPRLGVDVARFGDDESTIYRREGGWIRLVRAHSKSDTMVTSGHVAKAFRDISAEVDIQDWPGAVIDEDGVGGGVLDRTSELGLDVIGFKNGSAPTDKERFADLRSEMYWTLAEMFENGEVDIDPDDDVLAAQLGSIRWTLNSRGRIKTETKDDMRKRKMPSPDRADAVMMSLLEGGRFDDEDIETHLAGTITGGVMDEEW